MRTPLSGRVLLESVTRPVMRPAGSCAAAGRDSIGKASNTKPAAMRDKRNIEPPKDVRGRTRKLIWCSVVGNRHGASRHAAVAARHPHASERLNPVFATDP